MNDYHLSGLHVIRGVYYLPGRWDLKGLLMDLRVAPIPFFSDRGEGFGLAGPIGALSPFSIFIFR